LRNSLPEIMSQGRDFVDYAIELLGPFGTVSARRMFGGHGIFLDGLMFAIVHGDMLWFKTDELSRGEFEAAGTEPFSYSRSGGTATLGFHRAPVDALESPAAALPWARSAYAAALRARGKRLEPPSELALAPFVTKAPKPRITRTKQPATARPKKPAARAAKPAAPLRRALSTRSRTR
jgi:DNA transformation protein and related proteins